MTKEKKLLSTRQFLNEFQFMSEGGLRYLIFNEHKNGFSKVTTRMGKKILLDIDKFFEWLDEQEGENHA